MGEGIKPTLPVIRTHAALAKAAKAKLAGGEMNNGVIDASASEATMIHHFFCRGFILRKNIECQRVGYCMDVPHITFKIPAICPRLFPGLAILAPTPFAQSMLEPPPKPISA